MTKAKLLTEEEILAIARSGDRMALTHASRFGQVHTGDAHQRLVAAVYAALDSADAQAGGNSVVAAGRAL
jgi:hypothetical protein